MAGNIKKSIITGVYCIFVILLASFVSSSDRTIKNVLDYKKNSLWDANNDGIEVYEGVVDLTVENSFFSWIVNEDNICVAWELYSMETDNATIECYGSEACCSTMKLKPRYDAWNAPLYVYLGRQGATSNNVVSARVIYYDAGINYASHRSGTKSGITNNNIIGSGWESLPVQFIPDMLKSDSAASKAAQKTASSSFQSSLLTEGMIDVTISTPPVKAGKNFTTNVIITNFGKKDVANVMFNIMLDPCMYTDFPLKGIIPKIFASQNKILSIPLKRDTECLLKNYIIAEVADKTKIKQV